MLRTNILVAYSRLKIVNLKNEIFTSDFVWASDSFWLALKQQFIYPNFRFIFELYLDGSVPTLGLKSDFKYFEMFKYFSLESLPTVEYYSHWQENFCSNSQNVTFYTYGPYDIDFGFGFLANESVLIIRYDSFGT